MKRTLTVIAVAVAAAAGGAWYLHAKQPLRNGSLALAHLQAPVDVRYDERGVPHLYAQNQTDLYRALGYVHAQDRLFQMEMLRRLRAASWPKCSEPSWWIPTVCSAPCASATTPPNTAPARTSSRSPGRCWRPIWTGSTSSRKTTRRRSNSTCWAYPGVPSPPKTP